MGSPHAHRERLVLRAARVSFTPYGSTVFALHVADGSEIITRRTNGPSLTIDVGSGTERYGSCSARLGQARLAAGYLPVLQRRTATPAVRATVRSRSSGARTASTARAR